MHLLPALRCMVWYGMLWYAMLCYAMVNTVLDVQHHFRPSEGGGGMDACVCMDAMVRTVHACMHVRRESNDE